MLDINILRETLLFELKYRLASRATWICFFILILMAYREMLGGEWDDLIQSARVARNAPYSAYYLFMYYTFWAATVGAGLAIPTLLRDFRNNAAETLYALPICSKSYFLGKYLALMSILLIVMSSVYIGFITMPFVSETLSIAPAEEFIATPWAHLNHAFILWVLPACFIYGSLIFALTALTASPAPAYGVIMLAIGLFVTITAVYGDAAPNHPLVQIFDPLGKVTVEGQIYYWTVEDRLKSFLDLSGALLWNRIFYISLALLVLIYAFMCFDLNTFFQKTKNRNTKKSIAGKLNSAFSCFFTCFNDQKNTEIKKQPIKHNTFQLSTEAMLSTLQTPTFFYWLTHSIVYGWKEFVLVLKSNSYILAFVALILLMTSSLWSHMPLDIDSVGAIYPAGFYILPQAIYPAILFGLVGCAFFSVEVCAREQSVNMQELVDVCPIPSWALMSSKVLAAVLIAISISLVPVVSAFAVQLLRSYTEPNWAVFSYVTLLVVLPNMLVNVLVACICYALLNRKMLAQGLAILICMMPPIFNELSTVENHMLLFGWPFAVQLSDFSISNQFVHRDLLFTFFWLSGLAAFTIIAYWFWPRGRSSGFVSRFKQVYLRKSVAGSFLVLVFLSTFGATGWTIYSTMNITNQYKNRETVREEKADYENSFGKYQQLPQPKIINANLTINLYPKQRMANYSADLAVTNSSDSDITELHLQHQQFSHIASVIYNNTMVVASEASAIHRYSIYPLPTTLSPGEGAKLQFNLNTKHTGFRNNETGYHGTIIKNGSHFSSSFWPTFGYNRSNELTMIGNRRRFHLGTRQPLKPAHQASEVTDISLTDDANFVTQSITVTTASDQIAVAPGELVEQTREQGRNKFVYQTDHLTVWDPQLVSAQYEVYKEQWFPSFPSVQQAPIDIEIYFTPKHSANIDRMVIAAKLALIQNIQLLGAYPYRSLKIAEIPYKMADITTSGNLIVLPEEQGWIHDYRQQPDIDWIAYIIAREVSRIWWGQQVVSANTKGAKLLTEALPIVFGLRALDQKSTHIKGNRYIDIIGDAYLRQRTREDGKEVNVTDIDNQDYGVSKAALSLYSASQLLGYELFDKILFEYFRTHQYSHSLTHADPISLIEALVNTASTEKIRQRLQQLFSQTQHYDFRIENSSFKKGSTKNFTMTAQVSGKRHLYKNGRNSIEPSNDELGYQIFSDKNETKILHSGVVELRNGIAEIILTLQQQPSWLVIDPNRIFIDNNIKDNSSEVTER